MIDRLCNAIKDALVEMGKSPEDSVQDIWSESLRMWNTGLWMDSHFNIECRVDLIGAEVIPEAKIICGYHPVVCKGV